MHDGKLALTNVVVRPARASDAEAIARIYAHHVQHGTASFDAIAGTAAQTEEKIREISSKGWPFIVAERAETIMGYAYVTGFRDRPAYGYTCEDSIYVDPDCVGRGVGVLLMRVLMEQARTSGFRQMIAVIGGGEPASVALHHRMGFAHAGRMRNIGRKFGRWLDTVYMQAELGEGDRSAPSKEPA
ncbi:MAG: GNAT family N-acetyltransferase [Sphingomonadales bacterium 17-56-6]|nr:MAG: GNAT family N-acetyltransferase [Sphingomonadales bacterium 28-55-16]OYZ89080.1 MAG: GNAT family N-acetyltransferase [Sphingomonadales bacterium 17-56-6]